MNLDHQAFRALFEAQRERIFRFLYRLTGHRSDAEDLLQEAFLTVWRKRELYDGRGSAEGFLRQTAYRTFLNHREKNVRRRRLEPPAEPPPVAAPAIDAVDRRDAMQFLVDRVHEALDALPPDARDTFVMFRFENLTCREIAETTGTNVKTVETRLRRATLALAERLEPFRHHLPA